jgi:hypothetical protein
MPDLLSDELHACIDSADSGLEGTHEDVDEESVATVRKMFKLAIPSFEGFSTKLASKIVASFREDQELWEWVIDNHYSREAVKNIRGIVHRFMQLSHVPAGVLPSPEVSAYLREATRCYIYGFAQASIALSRAAMEAGLNEYLRRKLKSAPQLKLLEKIKKAEQFKLIDRTHAGMAEDVSKAAGMVLHQKPATSSLAFDSLSRARGVLLALYEK